MASLREMMDIHLAKRTRNLMNLHWCHILRAVFLSLLSSHENDPLMTTRCTAGGVFGSAIVVELSLPAPAPHPPHPPPPTTNPPPRQNGQSWEMFQTLILRTNFHENIKGQPPHKRTQIKNKTPSPPAPSKKKKKKKKICTSICDDSTPFQRPLTQHGCT